MPGRRQQLVLRVHDAVDASLRRRHSRDDQPPSHLYARNAPASQELRQDPVVPVSYPHLEARGACPRHGSNVFDLTYDANPLPRLDIDDRGRRHAIAEGRQLLALYLVDGGDEPVDEFSQPAHSREGKPRWLHTRSLPSMPDYGLFGPGSVTWRIHAHRSMLIGGLRALLVQALEPRAMAAVAQHSSFSRDPWARLRRTSEYLITTTFEDTSAAETAGARVRAVHAAVSGVDPVTGRPYRADDPELLGWVHAVEVDSFLAAYRVYGGRLSDADADRYVAEMVRAGELVGLAADEMPASVPQLSRYLSEVRGLCVSETTREAMRTLLAPPMPALLRPLWAVVVAAAVGILPPRARELYGLRLPAPATTLVRPAVQALIRALDVTVPRHPVVRARLSGSHLRPVQAAAATRAADRPPTAMPSRRDRETRSGRSPAARQVGQGHPR